jgi:hypothetical protein
MVAVLKPAYKQQIAITLPNIDVAIHCDERHIQIGIFACEKFVVVDTIPSGYDDNQFHSINDAYQQAFHLVQLMRESAKDSNNKPEIVLNRDQAGIYHIELQIGLVPIVLLATTPDPLIANQFAFSAAHWLHSRRIGIPSTKTNFKF